MKHLRLEWELESGWRAGGPGCVWVNVHESMRLISSGFNVVWSASPRVMQQAYCGRQRRGRTRMRQEGEEECVCWICVCVCMLMCLIRGVGDHTLALSSSSRLTQI